MIAKVFVALMIATFVVVQPAFAEEGVFVIDLGYATDDELTGALDAATEIELIMRTEWELYGEEGYAAEAAADDPELYSEEAGEAAYVAEEPKLEAACCEPELAAAETVEPEYAYVAEEAQPEAEAEYPAYYVAEEPAPPAAYYYVAEYEDVRYNAYFRESLRLVRLAEEAYERGDYDAAAVYAHRASHYAMLSDEHVAAAYYHAEPAAVAATPAEAGNRPSTFTVRSWAVYRDCLWNIAALPEVFGDPTQWRELFYANRQRMPDPNNPDLILPGMVLEIPRR